MIYHAYERDLVVQNASNLLENNHTLSVSSDAIVECRPKLKIEFIVPQVGKADPISIIACGSVRETKFILLWIEDNLDVVIATHGPHQHDDPLLTVDKPTHLRSACWPRITSPRTGVFVALPEDQGRNWKTAI